MMKDKWILHIDLISYNPKHIDDESTIEMQIAFDTQDAMNAAYMRYHSDLGERMTISGQYTIVAVEPSLYPIQTEPPASKPPF